MRKKGSRYENTRPFSEQSGFAGFRERPISAAAGILEHTVLHTDRIDLLAQSYYQNDRRWWRVMDANAEFLYGVELLDEQMQGDVIAIPPSREAGK